jgi:hypothetical protein
MEHVWERGKVCTGFWWRDWGEGKFVPKKAKLKLYLTTLRPVITYGSEIWVLKLSMK